jgi:hypothetical protein
MEGVPPGMYCVALFLVRATHKSTTTQNDTEQDMRCDCNDPSSTYSRNGTFRHFISSSRQECPTHNKYYQYTLDVELWRISSTRAAMFNTVSSLESRTSNKTFKIQH